MYQRPGRSPKAATNRSTSAAIGSSGVGLTENVNVRASKRSGNPAVLAVACQDARRPLGRLWLAPQAEGDVDAGDEGVGPADAVEELVDALRRLRCAGGLAKVVDELDQRPVPRGEVGHRPDDRPHAVDAVAVLVDPSDLGERPDDDEPGARRDDELVDRGDVGGDIQPEPLPVGDVERSVGGDAEHLRLQAQSVLQRSGRALLFDDEHRRLRHVVAED